MAALDLNAIRAIVEGRLATDTGQHLGAMHRQFWQQQLPHYGQHCWR